MAHEAGKASIIVVNKWDSVEKDGKTMIRMKADVRNGLAFMPYAPILFISALTDSGHQLFGMINHACEQSMMRIRTGTLNSVLADATTRVQPPTDRGRRLKDLLYDPGWYPTAYLCRVLQQCQTISFFLSALPGKPDSEYLRVGGDAGAFDHTGQR